MRETLRLRNACYGRSIAAPQLAQAPAGARSGFPPARV